MKAFPEIVPNDFLYAESGMDLRTYIAIEAMNALIIKTPLVQVTKGSKDECKVDVQQKAIVESSVRIADLMIEKLKETE